MKLRPGLIRMEISGLHNSPNPSPTSAPKSAQIPLSPVSTWQRINHQRTAELSESLSVILAPSLYLRRHRVLPCSINTRPSRPRIAYAWLNFMPALLQKQSSAPSPNIGCLKHHPLKPYLMLEETKQTEVR
jgi:hypothetical protein